MRVVYLIDDDPGISHALSLFLEHRGICVKHFTRVHDLLDHFQPAPHLCLVTDVRMPDMTGFEALDALAALGHEPPAILITGHGPPPIRFQRRTKDVAGILLKPFEPDELLDMIRSTNPCDK